jgi:hypothetical protein
VLLSHSIPARPEEYLKTFGLRQLSLSKIKQISNGRFREKPQRRLSLNPKKKPTRNKNETSKLIFAAAIEMQKTSGRPVLLESVYELAFPWQLDQENLNIGRQVIPAIHSKDRTANAATNS